MSTEAEEEIEMIEQKLKIAKRKGHEDKVKKLTSRLEKLRLGRPGQEYFTDEIGPKVPQNNLSDPLESGRVPFRPSAKTMDSIVVVLNPRQIKAVAVTFRALELNENDNMAAFDVHREASPVSNGDIDDRKQQKMSALQMMQEHGDLYDDKSALGHVVGNIVIHEAKNTDVVKYVRI